jgi:hypothetical protein
MSVGERAKTLTLLVLLLDGRRSSRNVSVRQKEQTEVTNGVRKQYLALLGSQSHFTCTMFRRESSEAWNLKSQHFVRAVGNAT